MGIQSLWVSACDVHESCTICAWLATFVANTFHFICVAVTRESFCPSAARMLSDSLHMTSDKRVRNNIVCIFLMHFAALLKIFYFL